MVGSERREDQGKENTVTTTRVESSDGTVRGALRRPVGGRAPTTDDDRSVWTRGDEVSSPPTQDTDRITKVL